MGNKLIEALSAVTSTSKVIASDVLVMNFRVVTACLLGEPNSAHWVLVDTGLENSAEFIIEEAEKRYGKSCPDAIILTHGHFDHVGSAIKLSQHWNVPVYIHHLELPYITGKKDYPLADPSTDEGMVAKMSPTFPHSSIDLGSMAKSLPMDETVPGMKDWKWIHTPGHTIGHISLYKENGSILIAGDAISTTKQESLLSVIMQSEKIGGPPKYLTENFKIAEITVRHLRDLQPYLMIPSHGTPLEGKELHEHLNMLVNNFNEIAVPKK
jgi:glyoxylase-like metal-dependent hydrolase (beta-lactamase superfamily II)